MHLLLVYISGLSCTEKIMLFNHVNGKCQVDSVVDTGDVSGAFK